MFEKFRQRAANWGLRRAAYGQLMAALARLGFRIHYVQVGVDIQRPWERKKPEIPDTYRTGVVALDDLLPFAGKAPDLDEQFLRDAFARGDGGAATFYEGELVAFSFESLTRCRVTSQLDVLIPPGFRYGYKDWVHPDHRRRNLISRLWYERAIGLPRPYEQRYIGYVETHNYPALLHPYVHPRHRLLSMGFVGWITLFGHQVPFRTRRAKWIGFEFVRKEDDGIRQYI